MRNKIIITLCLIVVIVGGLVGLALLNLNTLINKNKSFLLSKVEQSLGRKVSVDEVNSSFSGGMAIELKNFSVADDTAFSLDDFVKASGLNVNVEFFPLLSKKLKIKKLTLDQPAIQVIRSKDGKFNFESIAKKDEKEETESAKKDSSIELLVSLLNITDGKITYIDKQADTEFQANKINLSVDELDLKKAISVDLKAAVLSDNENIDIKGKVGPCGEKCDFSTAPIEGDVAIDGLDINALKKSFPDIAKKIPQGLDPSGNLQAKLAVSGNADAIMLSNVDVDAAVFGASKPNLKLTGNFGPIGGETDKLNLNGDIKLDSVSVANLKRFPPVKNALPKDMSADGELSLSTLVEGNPNDLSLKNLVLDATEASIKSPDFQKPSSVPLVLTTDASIGENAIDLKKTKILVSSLELTGGGKIGTGDTTSVNLSLNSNTTSLAALAELIPMLKSYGLTGNMQVNTDVSGAVGKGRTPNINGTLTLSKVGANMPELPRPIQGLDAKINFTGKSAKIDDTTFFMGNSQVDLSASIESFSPFSIAYKISSPDLYLSEAGKDAAENKKPILLKTLSSEGHLTKKNESLVFLGNIKSAEGNLSGIQYKSLNADISLQNDVLTAKSFSMQALEGSLQGSGKYEMKATPPRFNLAADAKSVDIKQLLTSLDSKSADRIQGQANLDLNISGKGEKLEDIKPNVQGTAKAEIVNGAVNDINIAEGVLGGITGIPGLTFFISPNAKTKYPQVFQTGNTEFQEFKASFNLGGGKMTTDDLRIVSKDYTVTGKGWVDFGSNIDFRAVLALSEKFSEDVKGDVKGASYLANKEGLVEIPFAITGALPNVKPRPDISYITQSIQRTTLEKGTEKLKEKLLDKFLPPKEKEAEQQAQEPQQEQAVEQPQQVEQQQVEEQQKQPEEQPAVTPAPEEEKPKNPEEALKKGIQKLFKK